MTVKFKHQVNYHLKAVELHDLARAVIVLMWCSALALWRSASEKHPVGQAMRYWLLHSHGALQHRHLLWKLGVRHRVNLFQMWVKPYATLKDLIAPL